MEVAGNSSFLTTDLDMAELDDMVAAARDGDGTATTKPTAETSAGSRPGGPPAPSLTRSRPGSTPPRRPWPDPGREGPFAPPLTGSRSGSHLRDALRRIEAGRPPPRAVRHREQVLSGINAIRNQRTRASGINAIVSKQQEGQG
ncbi:unnamed protein product [Miscanthus lutarioriparius]|uniref:Uncharacterized protein n=1 Tax=Miscanthus lutarioriparius TaxID=422564 RepID=A0A811P2Q0_9POAL|nr:unnamed protein product [Miscanthus lutarioriparius]